MEEVGMSKKEICFAAVIPPVRSTDLPEGYDIDCISYGQTGSGKTFTMFGPPFSMENATKALGPSGGDGVSSDGIILPEHGIILRSGLEILQAVAAINASGTRKATLHGSMVEMSIMTLTNQSVVDLINNRKVCFVDKSHHLQGAAMVPLRTAGDVVRMAGAVETRLVRGTKMNDTSSRSRIVVLCLHYLLQTVIPIDKADFNFLI